MVASKMSINGMLGTVKNKDSQARLMYKLIWRI